MNHILVTGATGTVGSTVVSLLPQADRAVTALVRDPDRARSILGHRVALARGDFADPSSVRAALDGHQTVLLCCGNVPGQVEYERTVIDEAVRVGVQRIVKVSAQGADRGAPVAYWDWHARIEEHLRRSGLTWVLIQPSFYMSNLFAAAEPVRRQGVLVAPAAGARITMVHPADVAAVVATALTDRSHDGQTYVVTGPDAISYADVAAELAMATRRRVDFVDVPPVAAQDAMVAAGLPVFAAQQIVTAFGELRRGVQTRPTGAVAEVTGTAPRSFGDFAREHAAAFGADAARLTA